MYLAYSALNVDEQYKNDPGNSRIDDEFSARYAGYLEACYKLRHEIADIQKFHPAWKPNLPTIPATKP